MKRKLVFKNKNDWVKHSSNLNEGQLIFPKVEWWDASKINRNQKQYMLSYDDGINLVASSKVHFITKEDLLDRGLYNVHNDDKIMEVVDVFVDPKFRNMGYCKELISDTVKMGKQLGRSLYLAVEGPNTGAMLFS